MRNAYTLFPGRPFRACWRVNGLLLAGGLLAGRAQAQQGVGIGTTAPNPRAALDIQAADKGLLIPRLDSVQRAAIASPPDGLMVFQKNGRVGLWYAFGGTWLYIPDNVKAHDNLGNHTATRPLNLQANPLTGTGASVSGVGLGVRADGGLNLAQNTTGFNLLVGFESGRVATGVRNQFVGYQSGRATTSGYDNTFTGYRSGMFNTTGSRNLFEGSQSGFSNTTGYDNVLLGYQTGYANTTGIGNVLLGTQSGFSNTTGYHNIFLGSEAGYANSTGYSNLLLGYRSGFSNTIGYWNQFLGFQSGRSNTDGAENVFEGALSGFDNTSGTFNVFTGVQSGYSNITGNSNTFVGHSSGLNSKGSNNTFLGSGSGETTVDGDNNVFVGGGSGGINQSGGGNVALGADAGPSVSGLTNAVAIGYGARVSQSNSMALGGVGFEALKVGIGTMAPAASLHVAGGGSTVRFDALAGTGTRLVLADANGNLAVQAAAGDLGGYTATQNLRLNNFWLSNDGGNEGIRVSNTGLVGVGTANPIARLAVVGAETATNGMGAALRLQNTSATTANNWYLRAGGLGTATPNGGFSIADDGAYRLVIQPNGNVGINTPSPDTKLDVNGDATVSGLVYMGWTQPTQSVGLPAVSKQKFRISCPAGTRLLGGGGGFTDLNIITPLVSTAYSGPDPDDPTRTWMLVMTNASADNLTIPIFCNCARIQ